MITAFAPATLSNLNCGFDVLGMAIDSPGDEVCVSFNDSKQVNVVKITGDRGKLPTDPTQNTAAVAVSSLLQALNSQQGIDIVVHKKMPLGSGLGSSAASAVAATVAANHLLGSPFSKHQLLPFVLKGEEAAAGSIHGDNVFPSLLGGVVLIRSCDPIDVVELPLPDGLYCVLIHPDVEILTKEARAILPKQVPLKDAVMQTGNIAAFVAALYNNDLALLGRSMTDLFAEPYRSPLIPHFQAVKNAAYYGGAISFGISGSGPSMFALSDSGTRARQISEIMLRALHSKNVEATAYVSKINKKGAYIVADS